uniref:hypothetical protein n=1 Tax=Candidatus Electronema sp. TaxID=2698783 RepID=UPI004055A165
MPESPESIFSAPVDEDEAELRRQHVMDLLDASEGKNFVFFFGMPASGKTTVLGSMLYAMQQPRAKGKLFIHGTGDNFFQKGVIFWKTVSYSFQNQRFPPRLRNDQITKLFVEYRPEKSEESLNIVFLKRMVKICNKLRRILTASVFFRSTLIYS